MPIHELGARRGLKLRGSQRRVHMFAVAMALCSVACGDGARAEEPRAEGGGDAGELGSTFDSGTSDDGPTSKNPPDAGPGATPGAAQNLACLVPVEPTPTKVPESAVPRQACTEEQIQALAAIAARSPEGLSGRALGDVAAFKAANPDCAACALTEMGAPRGPFYTDAQFTPNYAPNFAGCLALKSNPACGSAIYDRELCASDSCYMFCDDIHACAVEAGRTNCRAAVVATRAPCKGINLNRIGVGCLVQDLSEAGLRILGASIIRAFCGAPAMP